MRSSLRFALAATASAAMIAATAGPAAAVKPTRNCPAGGPFVLMTRAQLDVLALELFGSAELNEGLFAAYDKNRDAKLCVQDLTGTTGDPTKYNFVDNTAR